MKRLTLTALLLLFAVSIVRADALSPNGVSTSTDASFTGVTLDGSQTITQGGGEVQGCGAIGNTTPCTDIGTVDILYSGGAADELAVSSSKFYVDIQGSLLASIFGGDGLAPTSIATVGTQSDFSAFEGCYWQLGAAGPATGSACANSGSGYVTLTSIAPDTFVASFGSIGVEFSLPSAVPEPTAFWMLLVGLAALGLSWRKRTVI